MAIKVVATIALNQDAPDAIETYFQTAMPMLEKVGAKVLQQFTLGEAVVGEKVGETLMIVEYPDMQALDAVFGSAAYKAIIPARDKAFSTYNIRVISE